MIRPSHEPFSALIIKKSERYKLTFFGVFTVSFKHITDTWHNTTNWDSLKSWETNACECIWIDYVYPDISLHLKLKALN